MAFLVLVSAPLRLCPFLRLWFLSVLVVVVVAVVVTLHGRPGGIALGVCSWTRVGILSGGSSLWTSVLSAMLGRMVAVLWVL